MGRKVKIRGIDPPTQIGVDYQRRLLRLRDVAWSHIRTSLLPALERAKNDRADDLSDAIKRSLASLGVKLVRESARVESAARAIGVQVDRRHKGEFYRRLSAAVGVEVVVSEGFRGKILDGWNDDNAALIKSLTSTVRIRDDVERAFVAGTRPEVLAKRWRERGLPLEFGTLEGRAKVIARDQVSKLNGRLTQARQEAIGITEYTWRDSRDQRVRDSHEARNGKRFKWSSPPPDGHPGHPVQCRCVAEAVLDLDTIAAASAATAAEQPRARAREPLAAQPELAT